MFSDNKKEPQNPFEWVVWKAAIDLQDEAQELAKKLWGDRPPFQAKLSAEEQWKRYNRIRYNRQEHANIIKVHGPDEYIRFMRHMENLDKKFGVPPPVTEEDMHAPGSIWPNGPSTGVPTVASESGLPAEPPSPRTPTAG